MCIAAHSALFGREQNEKCVIASYAMSGDCRDIADDRMYLVIGYVLPQRSGY